MREDSIIRKNKIDWRQYEVPNLNLDEHETFHYSPYISCGSASLSLLTRVKPEKVEKSCPNPRKGWFTSRVVKYLRDKGYTVIELSKEDLLKTNWTDFPINNNHCLMMNIRMDEKENSMFILHKGQLWHHYDSEPYFNNLFFINKPTQDVLLIFHKKWK